MPTASIAAMPPAPRPVGMRSRVHVDSGYIIRASSVNTQYMGVHLLGIGGIDEAVGGDYRHVMDTRQPLRVRRFYAGGVWEFDIQPTDDGGLDIDSQVLYRVDDLTLPRFVSSVTQALAFLEGGATARTASPPPPAAPRSTGSVRLRVVPKPD